MKAAESKPVVNANKSGLLFFQRKELTNRLLEKTSPFFSKKNVVAPQVQTKLNINQPGDPYEQEADFMAEKILKMEQPSINSVQRKCHQCEEEDNKVHRKEGNGQENNIDSSLESYIGSRNSRGQNLSNEVRSYFEPRFGHDFSQVKIHTDETAALSAQSINALAYTSGNNIVFNRGQYSPETESGKRLLGHELTHVLQQQSDPIQPKLIQRQDGPAIPPTQDPFHVDPGGPFDVGDTICTIQFGPDGWEGCCPVPGSSPGSDNACFNDSSLDMVRRWISSHGGTLPPTPRCPPGQTPNPMMGSCCPPGQVPQGVQCVNPPPVSSFPLCLPGQRTLSGQCCTPPLVPTYRDRCEDPTQLLPTPPPSVSISPHYQIGLLDHFRINEASINPLQQPMLAHILTSIHQEIARCPTSFLFVTGFTDAPGDEHYNLTLGQQRADTVKRRIQEALLDLPSAASVAIFSTSEGRNNPVDTAAGSNYSDLNRRVQIEFYPMCPPTSSSTSSPPLIHP